MSAAADALFAGRHVLVQGATGNVGGRLLRELARQRARVSVAVRRAWQVVQVEKALAEAGMAPGDRLVAVVDSEDAEAAAGLVKGATDALGPLESFVSAAGAFAAERVGEEDAGAAAGLWRANFACVHTLARAVVIPMRRRRAGSLVFTGAAAVLGEPPPGMALYAASKAALHAYAASLRAELAPHGVHVSLVAPRIIDTPENRSAMPGADRSAWTPPERVAECLLGAAAVPPDALVVRP